MDSTEKKKGENAGKEVFVTYCSNNEAHASKVESLTALLKEEGFHATMDQELMQRETSIDFRDMMYRELKVARKVIIVLDELYKAKAEKLEGGVGIEFQYIRKFIDEDKTKYIIVSFDPYKPEIVPTEWKDRFVLDISNKAGIDKLLRRLDDIPDKVFPEVGERKQRTSPAPIKPLRFDEGDSKAATDWEVNEDFSELLADKQMGVFYDPTWEPVTAEFNGNKIKATFLSQAAEVLAAPNSKLSWSKSVAYLVAVGMDHDIEIPHNRSIISGGLANKRTGFLENLHAFKPEVQFEILLHLCNEYIKENGVPELRSKLIEQYGKR